MKTYSAKPSEVVRKWYVIDASEVPLGRLSSRIADLLMGKSKPMFTHHIDCGDNVIVINAANLVTTAEKVDKKIYYRHTGFPGGIKEKSLKQVLSDNPAHAVEHAVRGMLPANKLRPARLARLKVYANIEHPHEAQKPVSITVNEVR
jgi:large subunit ribosomal protein L13